MKLIFCEKCKDLVKLIEKTRKCKCGKCAGKYFTKELAVINTEAILVGIDNIGFEVALHYYKHAIANSDVKTYFTGWIPITPGYARVVGTVKEVEKFILDTRR
jgi:hypothetical protein